MNRYITAPEASGQNWMVSAMTTPTSRPGDHRAGERAQAADRHHDEGRHDGVGRHRRRDGPERRRQQAGDARDGAAEAEHPGQHARQVDAEQPDHLRVARARAQDAAERRVSQEQPQRQQHDRGGDQHADAILGDQHRPPDQEDAGQEGRRAEGLADAAVDQAHRGLDQQRQREGDDQADQRFLVVEPADQQPLGQHADAADDDRREDHRRPAEQLHQRQRQVGAQREEGAVREIDDAEQPEDDREPDRDQHVQAAENEAACRLREEDVQHRLFRCRISPSCSRSPLACRIPCRGRPGSRATSP